MLSRGFEITKFALHFDNNCIWDLSNSSDNSSYVLQMVIKDDNLRDNMIWSVGIFNDNAKETVFGALIHGDIWRHYLIWWLIATEPVKSSSLLVNSICNKH